MGASIAAGVILLGVHAAAAQNAPTKAPFDESANNPAFKRADVLAFIGVKPGWRVADIVAGRFTRALSQAVGPTGAVYAVEPSEIVKIHPEVMTLQNGLAASPGYGNITVSQSSASMIILPTDLDAVFIRQNYHDLHDPFMGPADVPAFNRAVFAALKPGGVYVVLDHAAAPGSGLRDTNTLHRIDPITVKSEVLAAGFVLDAESSVLRNSEDNHDKLVFDPSVHGRTDQFLLRFKKPR
jgi:predicted methyltransferase